MIARAPKAQDYSLVPGSLGPRRDFRITVGLREGWDADGRVFDVTEAVRTAHAWMKRCVEAGQPALSGMFTRAEVTYAWPRPDGTVGSDREPVALFTGEAVHAYLGHLPDETIEAMLNDLSIELGTALGQERIYVAFADRAWILDAGERRLARPEPSGVEIEMLDAEKRTSEIAQKLHRTPQAIYAKVQRLYRRRRRAS
jgi:hypothetical protein